MDLLDKSTYQDLSPGVRYALFFGREALVATNWTI